MSALDELEIPVSASCGSSAGAVVGGVLASGTDVRDWADAITHVRTEQYWTPRSFFKLLFSFGFHKGQGISGLSDTAAAVRFLSENLLVETFQECVYPFSSVAMNLGTGESVIFRDGPLALAMMASAAIPGFYDPVEIGGQYFTDGAIIDLAPAEAICCRYELDVLLVHHTAQHNYSSNALEQAFDEHWTMVKILQRLVFRQRPWYATGQPRSIHRCPCGCKAIVVVVEPHLPELAWPLTGGAVDILDAAHSHAISQLQSILEALRTEPHSFIG
jgi:predicted acylesterase/phospholipase RssA